jgi:hypothetical protein
MRGILLLYVILTSNSSFGQSKNMNDFIQYYNYKNEALFWFYEMQYDSANYYFEKSFSFVETPKAIDSYLYARSLWEKGRNVQAVLTLQHSSMYEVVKSKLFIDSTFFFGLSNAQKNTILNICELELNKESNKKLRRHFSNKRIFENDLIHNQNLNSNFNDSIKPLFINNQSDSFYIRCVNDLRASDSILIEKLIYYLKVDDKFEIDFNLLSFLNDQSHEWILSKKDYFFSLLKDGRIEPYIFCFLYPFDKEKNNLSEEFIDSLKFGLNPYFFNPWVILSKGSSPKKNINYDYYKQNKQKFNCVLRDIE